MAEESPVTRRELHNELLPIRREIDMLSQQVQGHVNILDELRDTMQSIHDWQTQVQTRDKYIFLLATACLSVATAVITALILRGVI